METDQSGAVKHSSLRYIVFCQKWTECPKGKITLWIFHSSSCFLIICHWPLLETEHKGRQTAELLAPK